MRTLLGPPPAQAETTVVPVASVSWADRHVLAWLAFLLCTAVILLAAAIQFA